MLLGERSVVVEINSLDELRELSKLLPDCMVTLGRGIRELPDAKIEDVVEFLELLSRYRVTYDLPVKTKTALWMMLKRTSQEGYKISPTRGLLKLMCDALEVRRGDISL